MEQPKETLRLRWRLYLQMGRPKEKFRLRSQLWVAVARLRLSDLHVRICLIRPCVAIYRSELLAHQLETARIEADYWKEGYQEDQGG